MAMNYTKLFAKFKSEGMSSYTIRKNKILGEGTLQALRTNQPVRTDIICRLCYLLKCQPGDIMDYIPDEKDIESIQQRNKLSLP